MQLKRGDIGLSDDKGSYEVSVFAEGIAQARDLVELGRPLLASVSIRTDDQGVKKLTALKLSLLDEAVENIENSFSIHLKNMTSLSDIKNFLEPKVGGRSKISLVVSQENAPSITIQLPHFYKITPVDLMTLRQMESVEVG